MSYTSFDFPHTHFFDDDLRELLRMIYDIQYKLSNFISINAIKYANPIQWNITTQYEANTVVIDANDGTAYLSVQPVPSGISLTNTDYWIPIFTLNLLSANQNITLRDDGANVIATFASNTNDWLIWNNTLYKVTQPIAVNEAYVVGYNLERYSVELFLNDAITYLENYVDTLVGDLNDLSTTDKSNIVNAINEIHAALTIADFVNVLDYGFDNTGTNDNSTLISTLPLGKVWLFPAGTYLFNTPITLNNFRVLGYGATFKAGASMGTFVTTVADDISVVKNNGNFIKGVKIDGDYKASILLNHTAGRVCNFSDLTLKNFNSTGILISYGAGIYENIHINQEYSATSEIPLNTVGIEDRGGDNSIINCSIVDCKIGIIASHGTNHINCYVWLSQNATFDGSIGYQIGDNIYANFENCTVDTLQTGFYFSGSYNGVTANEITWVFNTTVVSDALIQSLTTDTCLFAKLSGAIVNRISLINTAINVSNYHVKLLSDNLYTTPNNVANTYALPMIRNIIGANSGNVSNIRVSNYHAAVNSSIISSNYTITRSALKFVNDVLDGFVVLDKGDTTTEWSGASLFTIAGGVDESYANAYFSDNQYNHAGSLLV